jgi:AraC family transcriptional regulator
MVQGVARISATAAQQVESGMREKKEWNLNRGSKEAGGLVRATWAAAFRRAFELRTSLIVGNVFLRMTTSLPGPPAKRGGVFTEATAWQSVGLGWCQLFGSFRDLGYSIEWHDFVTDDDFDWSRSFHPGGLEICLNLSGRAEVRGGSSALQLGAATAGFYVQREQRLKAVRHGGERHRFITVEMSLRFLKARAPGPAKGLHPRLANWFTEKPDAPLAAVSEPVRLSSEQQQVVGSLRHPPVYATAQPMWYEAKALEIAATLLYRPLPGEEFFCQRVKRLNRERAQRVRAILKASLAEPPSLEELGRRVGCSPFHLSRVFAQETGKTITGCLRELRLERAAHLLGSGECNVTEAALDVGYNSLSHFTVAFREVFGCCPGLYPLKAPIEICAPRQARAC